MKVHLQYVAFYFINMIGLQGDRKLTITICVHLAEDLLCAFLRRGLVLWHLHHCRYHPIDGLMKTHKGFQLAKQSNKHIYIKILNPLQCIVMHYGIAMQCIMGLSYLGKIHAMLR